MVGVISSDNVRTLQERLAASQDESVAIMSQMRASIARREDLLTRYKVNSCTSACLGCLLAVPYFFSSHLCVLVRKGAKVLGSLRGIWRKRRHKW